MKQSLSLLLSLVVVLYSVSSLGKSFDEESVIGQKRSPGYKQERKQALKSPEEENDELILSLIEKYLKKQLAEKQHKISSHNPVSKPWGSVQSECGISDVEPKPDSRIVGGVEATPHSWPWQVLVYGPSDKPGHNSACGGSIFDSHWVITAAHCLTKGSPADYSVFLGKHNRLVEEGTEQEFKVKQNILHEDYNGVSMVNDIALMRLSEDVQFNRNVKPICLPDNDIKDGTPCVATGWGLTQSTGDENVLNQVYLPVISNSQCNEEWYRGLVKDTMICAGYPEGGKDTCSGDSGGPLVSFSEGKWKLYGVTSFSIGYKCAERPGVYTRVKSYLEWIQNKTISNTNKDAATSVIGNGN